MSRKKNLSDIEIRSIYKHKPRHSGDYKRVLIPAKVLRDQLVSNKSLSKARSISSIHVKSSGKLKSISPKLKKDSSNNSILMNIISQDISANFSQRSINDSYRAHKEPARFSNPFKIKRSLNEAALYEERLKSLSKMPLENTISEYFKIFEEIAEADKTFGRPLKILKKTFDEWEVLKSSDLDLIHSLKNQLTDADKKISALNEDRKCLDRRMHQIAQENLDLVRNIEDSEFAYLEVEEKLKKVTDFQLNKIEKSDENWKALVLENKSYAEVLKSLKGDLRKLKTRENKLLKLVIAMKHHGYPVEEIYQRDVNGLSYEIEGSESDRIVTGNTPRAEKPEIVPKLAIAKIEPEIFTTSNCTSLDNLSFL